MMAEQEREHITTGLDCWCGPSVESYPIDLEITSVQAGTPTIFPEDRDDDDGG